MSGSAVWIVFLALMISVITTGWVRKLALSKGIVDVPNQRSSHEVPTPRGGGLSIVIALSVGAIALAAAGLLEVEQVIAVCGGGLAVAVVGFVDDRHSVAASIRFAVHVGAALWALAWLHGLPPLQFGGRTIDFSWVGYVLGMLGIVWTLNLFNFMDGIDGIAASEALYVATAGALLALVGGNTGGVVPLSLALAAACAGFLFWNWPPAKIFMGDVGSGYLGFIIATLAIICASETPTALMTWIILGGVFFVDATVTLIGRAVRGERVHLAHRSHAYQALARRWKSHKRVTVAVWGVNVVWLLPCAWLATVRPGVAHWILLVSLAPLVVGALLAGAGRPEEGAKG